MPRLEGQGDLLGVLGFVDKLLDLANLFRDGNFFWTNLCALPQGLATPSAVLVIQESDPLIRSFIP